MQAGITSNIVACQPNQRLIYLQMAEPKPFEANIFSSSETIIDWRDLAFSHPERKIRLATSFSGMLRD